MKKVRVSTLAYLLSFQTTNCLMLLLFLMFSFSVSKHHNILISTYDVITVAKSSNLSMFFLFNFILIMIFLGSSKPPAEPEFDGSFSFPSMEYGFIDSKEKENDNLKEINLETDEDEDGEEVSDNENDHGYDGYDEDNEDDTGAEDEDNEDDDCRDNDLERRIEEFIAKVNNTWREEIQREGLLLIASI
ncbi:hypothetical protein HS088_TW18G00348 [Tripterygium wilfordii]|uniref:Uncharacterized protein n=1 Tax=Tripterygium wilfordii TaxID=458696 RepID=A0A7J7CBV9_TRIWF|nr:hypothetical protein HS088_TW18G00348 [Tripterygium wilfordii]